MRRLINIQQELKAPKNQRNAFGGYMYRSAEDILEAVKPLLAEQKVVLVINDEVINLGNRFYIKATATIFDEEGKEVAHSSALAREPDVKKGQDESQITGAASSYARKYALNGLFCIDDTKDADATNTHGKEEPAKKEPVSANDALVLKQVAACKKSIEAHGQYQDGDVDHKKVLDFANKIYSLGYQKEANDVLALLETKTEKDSIPF